MDIKKGATEVAPIMLWFFFILSYYEHLFGFGFRGRGEFVEINSVAAAIAVAVSTVPLYFDIAFLEGLLIDNLSEHVVDGEIACFTALDGDIDVGDILEGVGIGLAHGADFRQLGSGWDVYHNALVAIVFGAVIAQGFQPVIISSILDVTIQKAVVSSRGTR